MEAGGGQWAVGGRVLGRSLGAPPGRPRALRPGRLPHRTGGVRLIGQARRLWSFTPPTLGVVSSGKSGSHPPVLRRVCLGFWAPPKLASHVEFTPSLPTFLRLPRVVLICKPILAPFLPSPPVTRVPGCFLPRLVRASGHPRLVLGPQRCTERAGLEGRCGLAEPPFLHL